MLETIIKAAENFCIHQIREPYTISQRLEKKRTLIAYIDIETVGSTQYRVYIAFDPLFVQKIAKVFLEEDESDEETLIDMALETVNLIVGNAKVLVQSTQKGSFNIETPHFVKFDTFSMVGKVAQVFTIDSHTMTIAIKELDG
ncbi:MAG: chemotaxis protein CheX [Sulfurimonadaceae bacterium]|jgi:hypothetical protein|nr:chemotaxis protein CheX [Sulfurimonadaceae bacterium]